MPSVLSRIRESALPRLFDRVAGTPLLWVLGLLRTKRELPPHPRRFGIMMFETIGDTLLAGSLIASLRANVPGVELIAFVSRGNRSVLALFEGVTSVVEVPITRPAGAIRAIRSVPVDVMVDIGQWPRWYALLCALARARYTVGFATPGQTRHYAYDAPVAHDPAVHEVQNFQRLLTPIPGVRPLPPSAALGPMRDKLPSIVPPGPYVVVHPWASGFRYASREWPVDRWAALIARICANGFSVLVSGGVTDRHKSAGLLAACPSGLPVTSMAGSASLADLAAVLRGAAAVVAVNTGIMHLAALLDTPLVALHGPTSRRRWGPVGARSVALAPANLTGCEFLHLGFEYPEGPVDCMERITVEEVFAALCDLVTAPARKPD